VSWIRPSICWFWFIHTASDFTHIVTLHCVLFDRFFHHSLIHWWTQTFLFIPTNPVYVQRECWARPGTDPNVTQSPFWDRSWISGSVCTECFLHGNFLWSTECEMGFCLLNKSLISQFHEYSNCRLKPYSHGISITWWRLVICNNCRGCLRS